MTAQTTVNGKTKELVGEKDKAGSNSMPIHVTLVVVIGICGSFLAAEYYQDYIDAYQYLPRQGSHTPIYPTVAVLLYLLVIYYLIPRYMQNREPKQFTLLKTCHNYALTIFSFTALYKAMKEVVTLALGAAEPNFFWTAESLLCDQAGAHLNKSQLYFWFQLYYLSKYYELLDTVFICFAKKEPIFLHVYHHIITLWTIWIGMDSSFTGQWVIMTANCFIHVFMYYYYMLQTLGFSVWWKRYLTSLQIFQFVVDETAILSWAYFISLGLSCQSTWFSFWFAFSVITSFLVLFVQFYFRTYNPAARGERQKRPKDE